MSESEQAARLAEIERELGEIDSQIQELHARMKALHDERAVFLCPYDLGDVVEDKTIGTRMVIQKIVSVDENSWKLFGKRVYKTGFLSDSDHEMAPERHNLVKVGHAEEGQTVILI